MYSAFGKMERFLRQLWSVYIIVFGMTRMSHGRVANICPEVDTLSFGNGQAEVDEIFYNSDKAHTPLYYTEKMKSIVINRIRRRGESNQEDRCTWQNGLMYNTTCPHHFIKNTDKNRIPEIIIEARCNCNEIQTCLDGIPGSRCKPVKYFIPVLRYNGRRHKCDAFRYTQTVEEITVGCTCTYPKMDKWETYYIAPE